MRLILILLMAAGLSPAATYYVANAGSDAANGTSTSTPWQTIAHVNSQTFSPGDSVLLNRGDVWREQLQPGQNGSAGNPITFGAYGSGALPIINGSDLISSFAADPPSAALQDSIGESPTGGNNLGVGSTTAWVGASFIPASSYTVTRVDVPLKIRAGAPLTSPVSAYIYSNNAGVPGTSIGAALSTIQPLLTSAYTYYAFNFTGVALTSGTTYWLVLQTTPDTVNNVAWGDHSGATGNLVKQGSDGITWANGNTSVQGSLRTYITSGAGATNVWDAAVATQPNAVWVDGASVGTPQASKATLASANQWFWSGGTLYVYSASNPATGHTVEAADRSYAAFISQTNYITLKDLEATNANDRAVYLRNCTNATLQGLKVHDSVNQGVQMGIGGGSHSIIGSEIYNTGIGRTFGTGSCLHIQSTTTPSTISLNYMHDFSTMGGDHDVYDESGANTYLLNHFKGASGAAGMAMRIDNSGTNVRYNVFDSVPAGGIDLAVACSNTKIYHNTFYNTGTASPFATIWYEGDGTQSGVVVENNVAYIPSGFSVGFIVANATGWTSDYNDFYTGGNFGEWITGTDNSLAAWRTASGQDAHSTAADPKLINPGSSSFGLLATSPARNAGIAISGIGQQVSELIPDIGAYEYAPGHLGSLGTTQLANRFKVATH